jgi:uncharacterized membrane protein HdeD (DUF308 family)
MATTMPAAMSASAEYPVHLDVAHPEGENRWMILIRWLLALPHLAIIYVLSSLSSVIMLIAFFAILFTRKYPQGLFKLAAGIQRWTNNTWAYILFHNRYPPFSFDEGQYPPVQYTVQQREQYNRWLPLIKWLLAIPHYIILFFLFIAAFFVYLWTWVVVLVTGNYPQGPFNFLVGVMRWGARVTAYVNLMVDEYPPFSMQ